MKLINFKQIHGGVELVSTVNTVEAGVQNNASRITALENTVYPVREELDLTAIVDPIKQTEFVLSQEPNNEVVELIINDVVYEENKAFTVDRTTNTLTWTFTADADGFDLNAELADYMTVKYYSNYLVSANSTLRIMRSNNIPTNGKFIKGDIVLRISPQTGDSIGWICKVAGEPGEWLEIGITDMEHMVATEEDIKAIIDGTYVAD